MRTATLCIMFCNCVCAGRSGMAASRFLTAAAACEILAPFAAEIRKLYIEMVWNGMKWLHEGFAWCFGSIFFHFDAFSNSLEKCFKIVVFPLVRRDPVLELQFVSPFCVILLCYCGLQPRVCRSQWNGCVKVPHSCGCVRNTTVVSFAAEIRKSYWSDGMKAAN